jgi:hypothetical protein
MSEQNVVNTNPASATQPSTSTSASTGQIVVSAPPTTSASITSKVKEKDPRRVAAGKRLGAIPKKIRCKKIR